MRRFSFYAKTQEGENRKGLIEAGSAQQAAKILKERDYVVISVIEKSEGVFGMIKRRLFSRVGVEEVVNFTRQLATMINAGLVITDALTILKSQTENPNMVSVVDSIQKEIEGGSSFSDALTRYPQIFDLVYVALIRSGEAAGVLDKMMSRLADNLESKREFNRKIKGAMVYPVIIVTGMIGVGLVMMIFVVPKMLDLYQEFEATLPTPTIILMAVSNFMAAYWWAGLILLVGGGYGYSQFSKTDYGRIKIDTLISKLPVIGKLREAVMLTEFTRTLGLLIGGGILVVDALSISVGALKSAVFRNAVDRAAREVEKGTSVAVSLARTDVFPPLLPQMISVGEETGKLDEVLLKIASYFEQEGEAGVRNLTTAIEPFIMIIMGFGVAFLVIAVIMPIYNLTSQF